MKKFEKFERDLRAIIKEGKPYIGINWLNSGLTNPDDADRMTTLLIENGYKEKAETYNQKAKNGHFIRQPQEDWTK